jgi:hypothetical protein
MTSNKESIPQTKEALTKMGATKAPKFNPDDRSFTKLLGIEEDEMVPLSFARAILNTQTPYGKNSVTVNNPTDAGEKSITLTTENIGAIHEKTSFSLMQKPNLITEVSE